MSRTKPKPGPLRKSCHTCWRRRKKCDLTRPCCDRCLKGGFECLGYEDEVRVTRSQQVDPDTPNNTQPQPMLPAISTQVASSEAPGFVRIDSFGRRQDPNIFDMDHNPEPPILAAALFYNLSQPFPLNYWELAPAHTLQYSKPSWPQDQIQLMTHKHSPSRRSSRAANFNISIKDTSNCIGRILEVLRWSLPPPIDSTQIIQDNQFAHIIYEYRFQRCSLWFMNPPTSVRDLLIDRLKCSKTMMWTMWLGTKLFQAVGQDPRSTAARECIGWIDKLEEGFTTDPLSNPTLVDVADHLLAQLELVYLKFTTVDSVSGYNLLQKVLPKFLRLAASYPGLYMEHPNGNLVVSFRRAIGAPQHEFERFVIYDTAASFVLGVPPLVEYGYGDEPGCVSHGFEWIHGVPFALIEVISQINSWGAGSRVAPLDDWKALEKRILSWQPQLVVAEDEDSGAGSIARLAVQESWRHVVLIYLYMGMCGVSSHDSRVQASTRQIIRLGETVTNLPIGIHMFTHCVIAGIGARSEKYRSLIRVKLLSFKDTRVWLFRGPQFSKVLDHLWDGVGARGAPVTWNDYVRSRCAVVKI